MAGNPLFSDPFSLTFSLSCRRSGPLTTSQKWSRGVKTRLVHASRECPAIQVQAVLLSAAWVSLFGIPESSPSLHASAEPKRCATQTHDNFLETFFSIGKL